MITAFIPCRGGSQRIRHKNTRHFAGYGGGLVELKLRQLDQLDRVDRIVISTDDEEVMKIATRLRPSLAKEVSVVPRPSHYASSEVPFEEFIANYVTTLDLSDIVLWAHVTNPLVTSPDFDAAITKFLEARETGYDSLVTVTNLQELLWQDGKPLNYDRGQCKWPRSQDLKTVQMINHAAYVIPQQTLQKYGDRIGERPYFLDVSDRMAFDIDWPDQFAMAEQLIGTHTTHIPSREQ